jgi:hypothetical protein
MTISIITTLLSDEVRKQIESVKEDLKKMDKRYIEAQEQKEDKKKKKSFVEEQRQKYQRKAVVGMRGKKSEQDVRSMLSKDEIIIVTTSIQVLAKLEQFRKKIINSKPEPDSAAVSEPKKQLQECILHSVPGCESCFDSLVDENQADDKGWMAHTLKFDKDLRGKDLVNARRNDPDDYIVIDPRERSKEILEGQKNKRKYPGTSTK